MMQYSIGIECDLEANFIIFLDVPLQLKMIVAISSVIFYLSTSNISGFEQLCGTKLRITGFHVLQAGEVEQQQEGSLDTRMQVARSQPKPSS